MQNFKLGMTRETQYRKKPQQNVKSIMYRNFKSINFYKLKKIERYRNLILKTIFNGIPFIYIKYKIIFINACTDILHFYRMSKEIQ